jgi:hypothetical protein
MPLQGNKDTGRMAGWQSTHMLPQWRHARLLAETRCGCAAGPRCNSQLRSAMYLCSAMVVRSSCSC